jgi:adenylylsulfate kinase-like enzyme
MKLQSNKGILFLITGAQGAGKTTIGKKLALKIKKEFGHTIYCDGDILRNIFQFTDYSFEGRKKLDKPYYKFCNYIINQNTNIVFSTVSANWTKKQKKKIGKNFFEIYVTRPLSDRKKSRKKIFESIKNQKIIKNKTFDLKISNNNQKQTINISVNKIIKKFKK